jgi:hypothetical protein
MRGPGRDDAVVMQMVQPSAAPAPDAARAAGEGGKVPKLMQTFRMPRELVAFLKREALREGHDLTAHVIRLLEGVRGYFGLPSAATSLLESDRRALDMRRYDYLLHVLFQRSLEVRKNGPGFDTPESGGSES